MDLDRAETRRERRRITTPPGDRSTRQRFFWRGLTHLIGHICLVWLDHGVVLVKLARNSAVVTCPMASGSSRGEPISVPRPIKSRGSWEEPRLAPPFAGVEGRLLGSTFTRAPTASRLLRVPTRDRRIQ